MEDLNIKEFVNNMQKENSNYLVQASTEQVRKLKNLFSNYSLNKIIKFYSCYQPNDIPILNSGIKLLDIEGIISENLYGEPGKFLSKFGVFVFSTTIGGNLICIDANDILNEEPSILYSDNNFCSYNKAFNCVEIGIIPDDVRIELNNDSIILLNYKNIKKCLFKFKERFSLFLQKISQNNYGDIEDYVECNTL